MIPDLLHAAVDAIAPAGVSHIGFVALDEGGRILITEPAGHPHGVSATFSKVSVRPGESPSTVLIRGIYEQIGVGAKSLYPLPNVWVTSQSSGYYFAGHLAGSPPERLPSGTRLHWCTVDEAISRISQSQNPASRQRDVGLVEAASAICLSPLRRILLMVRELHRMSYERLRAPAYDYQLAWRCPVVPAHWTLQEHGGIVAPQLEHLHPASDTGVARHTYSSSSGQRPFGWIDAVFATPAELARRFITEFPEVVAGGWGPDDDYVRWFDQMLELTAPNGIYAAFGEYRPESDHLYASMAPVERVPLPPPGGATRREWHSFENRHPAAYA